MGVGGRAERRVSRELEKSLGRWGGRCRCRVQGAGCRQVGQSCRIGTMHFSEGELEVLALEVFL